MGTSTHLLSRFPPDVEGRIRQAFYRLQSTFRVPGVQGPIGLHKLGDHWHLHVGHEQIYIAFPNRIGFYKHGIKPRLENLLKQFAAGEGNPVTLRPSDVIIDIGANIGEFSLACQALGCQVYAFEPDPDVQGALTANTRGKAGIECFSLALWHSEGELSFFRKGETADSSLIDNGSDNTVKVRACRLDTIDALKQVPTIRLLKCDAEGAEPEVLAGAIGVLPKVQWLAIDCGPERGLTNERTLDAVREIVTSQGFEVIEAARGGREVLVARNQNLPNN